MASNGPPPKPDMRFAISPPPPMKRSVAIAVRERVSVRMDAGNIVVTGLLGIALASDGSSVEDGE
jgi:hypothetical protein